MRNFIHTGAVMVGVDLHTYITGIPPFPTPVLDVPHLTYGLFNAFNTTSFLTAPSVRTGGEALVKSGHEFYLLPHLPCTALPPHPTEALELLKLLVASSSKVYAIAYSVTSGGKPLAICMKDALAFNINCCEPIGLPSGFVMSLTTVQTASRFSDSVGSLVDTVISNFLSYGVKLGAKGIAGKVAGKSPWFPRMAAFIDEVLFPSATPWLIEQQLRHLYRRRKEVFRSKDPVVNVVLDASGHAGRATRRRVAESTLEQAGL